MPTLREPPAPPKVPAYDEHRRLGPNKLTRHVGQPDGGSWYPVRISGLSSLRPSADSADCDTSCRSRLPQAVVGERRCHVNV